MTHLFETAATNRTRIVAISNTHTLTTKLPDDATTLHFSPYTADEMSAIIRVRLAPLIEEGIMVIQPTALTFICKKVATQTGDLRACLSLLCQALAMVEKMAQEKEPLSPTLVPVGMADVLKVSKVATTIAPTVGVKVKDLNMQSRLVLLTFLIASRRLTSGLTLLPSSSTKKERSAPTKRASITPTALHTLYESTLTAHGVFNAVSWSEFLDVLGVLEVQGLLSVDDQAGSKTTKSPSKRQTSRESSLSLPVGVRVDEVVKVLTAVEDAGVKEQEIRRMWERQAFAIDKEAQRQQMAHALKAVAFEDVVEA
jgi:cell division control protein 6